MEIGTWCPGCACWSDQLVKAKTKMRNKIIGNLWRIVWDLCFSWLGKSNREQPQGPKGSLKLHEKNMNRMVKNQTATRMHLSSFRKVSRNSSTPVLMSFQNLWVGDELLFMQESLLDQPCRNLSTPLKKGRPHILVINVNTSFTYNWFYWQLTTHICVYIYN